MTQSTTFFFDSIQNSTELYRDTPVSEDFNLKSFFDEPTSNGPFIEVDAISELEDDPFRLHETFEFPLRLQEKFIHLVSSSSEKSQRSTSKKVIAKETKTKRIKRTKRTRKAKKVAKKRTLAKSEITKNACCNIVQKTISLIKKGEFDEKLAGICKKFKVEVEEFKVFILNEKTRFTGTKALERFLTQTNVNRYVFGEFLGWFLREKYIRYAIKSGEMSNLGAYIKFKNEVILPLL